MERHWKSSVQLIPWFVLAAIAAGVVLLVAQPRPATVWTVRAIVAVVFVIAAFGMFAHVRANHDAGPLDARSVPGPGHAPASGTQPRWPWRRPGPATEPSTPVATE